MPQPRKHLALPLLALSLAVLACSRAERAAQRLLPEVFAPSATPAPAPSPRPTVTPAPRATPDDSPRAGRCRLVSADGPLADSHGDLRLVDLGALGSEGRATVSLLPGDVSVLFMARTADSDETIVVDSISGPSGEVLYMLHDYDAGDFSAGAFAEVQEATGEYALVMPAAPQAGIGPGDYTLSLWTLGGGEICASAALIRSGEVDGPGVIDLNVWVVSQAGELASPGERQSLELNIRQAVDGLFAPYGLELGRVGFFDSTPKQRAEFSSSNEDDYDRLCTEMGRVAGAGRAWNMVLTDELLTVPEDVKEEPEAFFGLSVQPGSVFVPGPNSCFLVAWEIHEGNFQELGATIVHEGSHFLGLPHTTEDDGRLFDLFADTPECPLDQFDQDDSGDVDDVECGQAGGADNYMFWNSSEDPDVLYWMSPHQAWTIRRHPLFHRLASP